jgi:uncharacterized protein YdaU (DUF1376 family)
VYASDDLSTSRYFGLSAGERGLLDSMARSYWVERSLPCDPRLLARVVRLDHAEVAAFLTPAVLAWFVQEGDVLHHLELRRQLANIALVRAKQSAGGTVGALITNEKRGKRVHPRVDPQVDSRVSERNEMKELKRQNQSLGRGDSALSVTHSEWVNEYDSADRR